MSAEPFQLAYAWASALTGDPDNAVFNWRFIHDQDKGKPAIKRRGTLAQMWQQACNWNAQGYGIFATVNEMDGTGYDATGNPIRDQSGDTLEHVAAIRTHVVDLDNLSAMTNLQRAASHYPAPQFAVQTSPGKAHVYWVVTRYRDNEFYRLQQRKLRQLFDGDPAVIDATRVLRVPGFWHRKGEPHLVTCYSLPGAQYITDPAALAQSVAHINAADDFHERKPLGDPSLTAPSREWVIQAIRTMPVDGLEHSSFISFLSAWKQAAWNHLEEHEARQIYLDWCATIPGHKGVDYDLKHWNDIKQTEIGWKSLLRQNPNLNASFMFYGVNHMPQANQSQAVSPIPTQAEHPGELLFAEDCAEYFKGCTFVTQFGEILDPKGQLLNSTKFNGKYGGPRFVINPTGQPSNEPWTAATRSVFWRIPVVDYLRFLPHEPPGAIVADELGRTGVNTFKPALIRRIQGDPSPFYYHLDLILPDKNDQRILLDYIAHNAKYPGHKIPWAPLVQSVEGAGKGIFKSLFSYLVGSSYFHSPNAKELVEGGSKFNAWMRGKLFILVDEIKTDERRDMIEVLKPWISEKEIEIQGKGHDQRKEDNYANWAFFSNYKDAVPINQNSRRFAIFYSTIQSTTDLHERDMNDGYYSWLYNWFDGDGCAILANHFVNEYELERGAISMRAPKTSSHSEAVKHGRSPTERAILDAVESGLPGFRGGWISTIATVKRLKEIGVRVASQSGLERIIEGLGYHLIGKANRPHFQEENGALTILFNVDKIADPEHYGSTQGYGDHIGS